VGAGGRTAGEVVVSRARRPVHQTKRARQRYNRWLRAGVWAFLLAFAFSVVGGLVIFGAGSAASALATSANMLIVTRAFMGIGGACIMPATLSIITNVFSGSERPKAIGVWAATAGVGVALGPLTGGALLEHFYWGSIFLVNIPIAAVAIAAGAWLVPTSKDPAAPKLDPLAGGIHGPQDLSGPRRRPHSSPTDARHPLPHDPVLLTYYSGVVHVGGDARVDQ